jgi:hypothetical protein
VVVRLNLGQQITKRQRQSQPCGNRQCG